ncbi:hypothetical protein PAXRUDRAFT_516777 [Paxillus rubicundulus Ve08.2h10]|uniref:2-(3-amino-3-carboxypropyl)histidine synthase n=1 Tax=Paxillus rubicundulus Ve08.2h10 TaxID=930991 RepID=A0A0D0E6N0_9AGAM|nr:hypothetical protein PAXRUDRAFT_516777 [Paxillus rubicundulus Ve08.2h10]
MNLRTSAQRLGYSAFSEFYEIQIIARHDHRWRWRFQEALQFDDELLHDFVPLYRLLKQRASDAHGLYVLSDRSYGSCCVDEVVAQHVDADMVVHSGHACMSKLHKPFDTTLPVSAPWKHPCPQEDARLALGCAHEYTNAGASAFFEGHHRPESWDVDLSRHDRGLRLLVMCGPEEFGQGVIPVIEKVATTTHVAWMVIRGRVKVVLVESLHGDD